jgi:hypothetical protein
MVYRLKKSFCFQIKAKCFGLYSKTIIILNDYKFTARKTLVLLISIQTFNYFRKSIEETKLVFVHAMKAYGESGDAALLILKLGIGQR